MHRLEYSQWFIVDPITGHRRPSGWKALEASALARDPRASRVPGTSEFRDIPEMNAAGRVETGHATSDGRI